MGVRLFADAGAALSREEIQTRVMDVLKLFDKVEPEKASIQVRNKGVRVTPPSLICVYQP